MQLWKPVTAVLLGGMLLIASYVTILADDLAANSGFNNPFQDIPGRVWRGQAHKVAAGWNHFYIEENTFPGSGNASKLRWMSSAQFAAAFGGYDYKIEGDQSQNLWSSYEFEGGVYQQVTGVQPGRAYGFDIGMVTFWRGPGYKDTNGKMVKQVGIDPFGGTDPTAETVIWSEPDADDKRWVYMEIAAVAKAETVTVFAKVQAPENDSYNHTDLNMVYFDAAHIDVAPALDIITSNDEATINAAWTGEAAPGWSLKGFEVQYRDQAEESWTTLQRKDQSSTQASFEGLAGHTYLIRGRAWQRKAESYNSDIDMPGVWVEAQVTLGNSVAGRIFDHAGLGLEGVAISAAGPAVSAAGPAITTTSTTGGRYFLPVGDLSQVRLAAAGVKNLTAPPPISITVSPSQTARLDITLRPAGDKQRIANNDFETDLSNWSLSRSEAAAVSEKAAHSGRRSLLISDTARISQTAVVTDFQRPLLSFWRKNDAPFTVDLAASSTPLTLTIQTTRTLEPASAWTHTLMEWPAAESYTGTIGVAFVYAGEPEANIFIDEVSLASGPLKMHLPAIIKVSGERR